MAADKSLLRGAMLFTGALAGSAMPGVALPLDQLIDGLFAHRDAQQRQKLRQFAEAMAGELTVMGPADKGTREAVCLKIEAALRRCRISYHRLAERAQIAKTRLRYRDAATLLAEAADLTAFDPEISWRYHRVRASVLKEFGREFGDNAALLEAITICEQALVLTPCITRPTDWAATQINLGDALAAIGSRESSTDPLQRAVETHEAALLLYTHVPLHWAGTQSNLGKVLHSLGSRESGTATLERAVEAYEAALLEYTRERMPNYWAAAQENLAAVRLEIGRRRGDAGGFRAALAAVDRTLEEYRAVDAAFYIWKAERLRERIVVALRKLGH